MFIVVRHGNTFEDGEPPRRIGARTDLPLTAKGLEQSHALGRHFATKGWRFGQVLVSPLTRTQLTAQAILSHLPGSAEPMPCDWLREIDHGPDENMDEDAVLARVGASALADWDSHALAPEGWIVDPDTRIAAWRELFASDKRRGLTLLVTSNGAARFALIAAKGATEVGEPRRMKLPTGSYGVIRPIEGGGVEIVDWGRRP